MRNAHDTWWICSRPILAARLRLFCFPYAGGAASVFQTWPLRLPAGVELRALELPGRGRRRHEAPQAHFATLVDAAAAQMQPLLDRPFALFGHSLGALLAFETARWLRRWRRVEPVHLFVSARRGPAIADPDSAVCAVSDEHLRAELLRLNGTPTEVLQHPELMDLLLPMLRADFGLLGSYSYNAEPPLTCPLTTFGGRADAEGEAGNISAWRNETLGAYDCVMLDGDHFFIHTNRDALLRSLAAALQRSLATFSSVSI